MKYLLNGLIIISDIWVRLYYFELWNQHIMSSHTHMADHKDKVSMSGGL